MSWTTSNPIVFISVHKLLDSIVPFVQHEVYYSSFLGSHTLGNQIVGIIGDSPNSTPHSISSNNHPPNITTNTQPTHKDKRKKMTPPILLLKTKSTPDDAYAEFFSTHGYNPLFIPVLEHNFNEHNLETVKRLFETGELDSGPGRKYGGLIFTSQRAVEGFGRVLGGVGGTYHFPLPPLLSSPEPFKLGYGVLCWDVCG